MILVEVDPITWYMFWQPRWAFYVVSVRRLPGICYETTSPLVQKWNIVLVHLRKIARSRQQWHFYKLHFNKQLSFLKMSTISCHLVQMTGVIANIAKVSKWLQMSCSLLRGLNLKWMRAVTNNIKYEGVRSPIVGNDSFRSNIHKTCAAMPPMPDISFTAKKCKPDTKSLASGPHPAYNY